MRHGKTLPKATRYAILFRYNMALQFPKSHQAMGFKEQEKKVRCPGALHFKLLEHPQRTAEALAETQNQHIETQHQ